MHKGLFTNTSSYGADEKGGLKILKPIRGGGLKIVDNFFQQKLSTGVYVSLWDQRIFFKIRGPKILGGLQRGPHMFNKFLKHQAWHRI